MNVLLNTTEARFVQCSQDALITARNNPILLTALSKFGYDVAKIKEGEALLQTTQNVLETNILEDVDDAIARYNKTLDAIKVRFSRHKSLCKRLFKNKPEILIVLGIGGPTPKRDSDYILYAKRFYTELSISNEIFSQTKIIGLDDHELKLSHDTINQLILKSQEQMRRKAELQQTTLTKNSPFLELKEWMEDFDNVAHMAFFDKPQLLESLGICDRN